MNLTELLAHYGVNPRWLSNLQHDIEKEILNVFPSSPKEFTPRNHSEVNLEFHDRAYKSALRDTKDAVHKFVWGSNE